MIPQMTVVVDLTRGEDELSLKPGYAVGDCHARRLPSVREAQWGNLCTARALHAPCALLLDYVPPKEPPSTPLGNTLRIR